VPDDYGYYDFGDPALSPDGTKLALTDDGDVNTNTRLWVASVPGPAWVGEPPYENDYLSDPLPQPPELKCQHDTGTILNPTWSPDSNHLAYSLDDGVHVWDVPDGLDCGSIQDHLLAPDGSQPDWGPADVDLAQKPSPPEPDPQPDARPDPQPGPGPGAGPDDHPGLLTGDRGLELSALSLKPKAFKPRRGTKVSFTLSAPARLTFKVAGARGSIKTAGTAGSNTLRFRARIAGRTLKPGRYTLRLTATPLAGGSARKATAAFRITR
jgi:WD40-like Beta Propeller Repeat